MKPQLLGRILVSVLVSAGLVWAVSGPGVAGSPPPLPPPFSYGPNMSPQGHSMGVWEAMSAKWGLELPVGDCSVNGSPPGHPYLDCPNFDVTEGQSGKVWFLAAPGGTNTRACTIPKGKSLFFSLASVEFSSLEGFSLEQDQHDTAVWYADHIVPSSLFCSLDGVSLANPSAYRYVSPQFTFNAPTPWIFGPTGGPATGVGDGYFVFLKKLSLGQHTLHFGGAFHFAIAEGDPFDYDYLIDQTYNITQLGG